MYAPANVFIHAPGEPCARKYRATVSTDGASLTARTYDGAYDQLYHPDPHAINQVRDFEHRNHLIDRGWEPLED